MLIFEVGEWWWWWHRVNTLKNECVAHFQGRPEGGGDGSIEQPPSYENEGVCSFSRLVAPWQIATALKNERVAHFRERRVVASVVAGQSNHPRERAYMHVFVGGGGGGD